MVPVTEPEVTEDAEPLKGLVLGPLLGQGSYGRVYRARWQGSAVAVKVGIANIRFVVLIQHNTKQALFVC